MDQSSELLYNWQSLQIDNNIDQFHDCCNGDLGRESILVRKTLELNQKLSYQRALISVQSGCNHTQNKNGGIKLLRESSAFRGTSNGGVTLGEAQQQDLLGDNSEQIIAETILRSPHHRLQIQNNDLHRDEILGANHLRNSKARPILQDEPGKPVKSVSNHTPLSIERSVGADFDEDEYTRRALSQSKRRKQNLKNYLLIACCTSIFPLHFCFYEPISLQPEISGIFDEEGQIVFFCLLFITVELPRIAVPFILNRFTPKLYQRQVALVFGCLVFASNLAVFLGLSFQVGFLVLIGRFFFGIFSSALTQSIHAIYGKWQSRIKHGPYHLLSKISAHIGVVAGIWVVAIIANKELSIQHQWRHDNKLSLTESMGLGMLMSLGNLLPIYLCFRFDKSLAHLEDGGGRQYLLDSKDEEDREMQREMRSTSAKAAPRLNHLRQFGKGFWIFTAAHSLQNAILKTFLALSVAFLVSDWEQFSKLQAANLAVVPFIISSILAGLIYNITKYQGHRLKTFAIGCLIQLLSMAYLLLIMHLKSSLALAERYHDTLLWWFFLTFGFALAIKIAIFPQVMPFIVKDEMKIDSATSYNQSLDHLFTSVCLLTIALLSHQAPSAFFHSAAVLLLVLSAAALHFYLQLFRFDRDKKGSLLDLKPLGHQKNYIDFSRQKLHSVKLNSENKAMIMSPLIAASTQGAGGFSTGNNHARGEAGVHRGFRNFEEIEQQTLRVPRQAPTIQNSFKLGIQRTELIKDTQQSRKEETELKRLL